MNEHNKSFKIYILVMLLGPFKILVTQLDGCFIFVSNNILYRSIGSVGRVFLVHWFVFLNFNVTGCNTNINCASIVQWGLKLDSYNAQNQESISCFDFFHYYKIQVLLRIAVCHCRFDASSTFISFGLMLLGCFHCHVFFFMQSVMHHL